VEVVGKKLPEWVTWLIRQGGRVGWAKIRDGYLVGAVFPKG